MQPVGLLSIPSPKAAESTTHHTPADDGRETEPTPPTTGKKAKTKKTKPQSAVAPPPAPAPSPSPARPPTPAPGPKSMLSAILQGDFADSHILLSGPSHRISGALDAADALVELLAADPTAASVDLVLSTTLRALKAVQAVFSRMVARYGSTAGTSGACSNAAGTTWDPALTLEALVSFVGSLVRAVIPALLVNYASAERKANSRNEQLPLKRARTARATAKATATAIDDILGGVYELLLVPAVRANTLLSEGHLAACFAGSSTSRRKKTLDDAPPAIPDLRPDVFTLLEGLLAILDDVLPHIAPPRTSARSPAAALAPIPGSDQVKTMLALECIRELERLYHPDGESTSQDAPDSPAQAYSRPANASASLAASSSGTPGTAPAVLPFLERVHPRAARDLGETASGPAQHGGPVRDRPRTGAASASGGKAKRGRRAGRAEDVGIGARIAKLARKDAVWWLCAVLDRLLPCLPPPSAGPGPERETAAAGDDPAAYSGPVPAYNGPTGAAALCADVAHEAVYAALADLLRRTRARASPRACSSHPPQTPPPASSSSSPRGLSPRASNHAESSPPAVGEATGDVGPGPSMGAGGGKPKRGLEKASVPSRGAEDWRAGWAGAGGGMGEVEQGMLLAVLERAWLGV
ncbi:hypothetical protein TRAPUB_4268 [Trametes pubescens]|uniref:Uncharacterized protein n=1 Tax=Trametes pubescens TaxID=154538 RepID=A0A1M2VBM4_TRAPU|nr:hypothetical protein TRAPUB_4268 [Trametes pubescens]